MLLQGQHDAVGNDGCQDHVLEGSGGELRSREEVGDTPNPPAHPLFHLFSPWEHPHMLLSGRRVKPTSVLLGNEG